MKAQINPAQYELVFTQVLDGSSINHKDIEIPETNFKVKREFEPKSNIAYKQLDGESIRRAQFKKEEAEFIKKVKSEKYQENMKDIQLALAASDVFLSKIGSLQTA